MILECANCALNFEGDVLCDYTSVNPDDIIEACKYTFAKCPKCDSPILFVQEREVDINSIYWGSIKILYPQTDFHINPVIPDKLRETLVESVQCYKAKSYTATTIMCRRAIEGFCTIKGIKEKNLSLSIKKLKADGIINEQLFEWANELRLLGNEAAHNIEVVFSATDARDTLDFTIAILDFTYSFKDKFEKFKNRLQKSRDAQNPI
jgi:hypothetical protein